MFAGESAYISHLMLLYSNCSEFVHGMVHMCDKFDPRERGRESL